MKKRKSYGTVMVDINTHRIVDMIESREYDAVSEWLKSYPNLEVVSRDGSITYKNAIETAHPKSKQISDRFHLLKNLTTYAIEYLRKELNAYITVSADEKAELCNNPQSTLTKANENRKLTVAEKYDKIKELSQLGYMKTAICKEINMDLRFYEKLTAMTSSEREKLFKTNLNLTHDEKVDFKMKSVNEVRGMKKMGLSNREISRRTGLDHRTVAKYIDEKFNPSHAMYGVKKGGILTPYMKEIDSMLESLMVKSK